MVHGVVRVTVFLRILRTINFLLRVILKQFLIFLLVFQVCILQIFALLACTVLQTFEGV